MGIAFFTFNYNLHIRLYKCTDDCNSEKMDLREIGWCYVVWIDLAQDRDWWRAIVNTAMKPLGPIQFSAVHE
jgi:hypothetical protein